LPISRLIYKINSATVDEILAHLIDCEGNFTPPLNQKVEISLYANKIFNKSVTFEAWSNGTLVGLVASYFNSSEGQHAFITNVSVIKEYGKKGIASELMSRCIKYATKHNFKRITLEVFNENKELINFYKKFSFEEFEKKGDYLVMRLETNIK
jgi:ribosomal protein S18 acetylase RimI-like enzyme